MANKWRLYACVSVLPFDRQPFCWQISKTVNIGETQEGFELTVWFQPIIFATQTK
jgi:hypothetical protein